MGNLNATPTHVLGLRGVLLVFLMSGLALYSSFSYSGEFAEDQEGIATLIADRQSFIENYDKSVQVSGTPLVGLRLVDIERYGGAASLAQGDVRVLLPKDTANRRFCARAVTIDGKYLAENTYDLNAADVEIARVARLDPLTVRYSAELQSYEIDDFALRVFVPLNNCQVPAKAMHLPEVLSDLANFNGEEVQLQVRVNGGPRRVSAYLYPVEATSVKNNPDLEPLATGKCERLHNNAGLAYNNLCHIGLENIGNQAWIRIVLNDGRRDKGYAYKTYLPDQ